MTVIVCPCQILMSESQQQPYLECCEPLHKGIVQAQTAEQLMRSRYCAFVLQYPDYIVDTTLPAQQKFLNKNAITDWSIQTQWLGLEVLGHIPKVGKRHAQVEFKAYYQDQSRPVSVSGLEGLPYHHELSTFVKVKNKPDDKLFSWYFLDPTIQMTLTQKQPCLCGSGEKFKRCCGAFM